jgi:hypothetical protein
MRSLSPVAWLAFTATTGVAVALIAAACSTGADGVQACQSIETARCQAAPSCPANFDLQSPDPDGNDVTACIRFYKDQCLHGLVTTVVPSSVAVNDCVAAILSASKTASAAHSLGDDAAAPCATIVTPQNNAACFFLNGVDAGEDAGPCTGSSQCVGSTNGGGNCCATVYLTASPDGGAFPNCGVSSITSYCGVCSSDTIGPTCLSTESVHLCSLESDCSNESTNVNCCQLNGYQACVNQVIANSGVTCL